MSKENWFSQIQEDVLWHYTTTCQLENFIGENKCLNVNTFKKTNDIKEFEHGREIFQEAVSGLSKLAGIGHWNQECKDNTPDFFNAFTQSKYIFCMSPWRDQVAMWKVYPRYIHCGIAIGFDIKKIKEKLRNFIDKPKEKKTLLSPFDGQEIKNVRDQIHFDYCLYDRQQAISDAQHYTMKFFNWETENDPSVSDCNDLLKLQLLFLQEEITSRYKNESFAYEKEVRISYWLCPQKGKDGTFEPAPDSIPLFPIKDAISQIIVSPLADFKTTQRELELIMQRNHIQIDIQRSNSTYREI